MESESAQFYNKIKNELDQLHGKSDPESNNKRERKLNEFRKQFSIPFPIVNDLIQYVENSEWYHQYKTSKNGKDAAGRDKIPVYLLVIEHLKILTRGCSFNTLTLESRMSISSMQSFFHLFNKHFAQDYYQNTINYPTTVEKINETNGIYSLLGFPGCIGSTDCVHVDWNCCPASKRIDHVGMSGKPTISYEFTVNHHKDNGYHQVNCI